MAYTQRERWPTETFAQSHRPHLLQLARRLCRQGGVDPEDLVQETLERALEGFDKLSPADEPARRAWLCTTLTNRFLDLCRRRRTEMLGLPGLRLVQEQVTSLEDVPEEPWASLTEEELREAVGQLKPKHREVYQLHATGMRYKQIAQQLGIPIGTVGYRLLEARQALKEMLTLKLREGGGRRQP
ncbi:RNA polymerase sigma factor [Archangium violaceum]|uniref:RNA polymerase sigma factor n=1 Tax=Archangium violaceum TaxID=83451 RepID=UPI00193BABFF|nr:RNA polymerase sigma factor [Archangium violaceum]QRK09344.1 RNA polymerase sigma factor [Archangium violaceum]